MGWLKVFGVSAASQTAFPILMFMIIAAGTIARSCTGTKRQRGLMWLVPLGVTHVGLFALRPSS